MCYPSIAIKRFTRLGAGWRRVKGEKWGKKSEEWEKSVRGEALSHSSLLSTHSSLFCCMRTWPPCGRG
jgi:hypothetical protein